MGFLKSSIKSVGTLLLADFLFYGVAQSATPIFYERIDYMKKIRSYTSIWSVEKVLYSINDFRLPFPITFTQMTWFVVSLFAVMILGNLPPLSMEGTEKVDYTVYIWYNVSIKYRRCFYDRTTAEIDAKSIHGNI